MYYTDWGNSSHISKANYDGSNIVVLREHPRFDPTIPYPLHGKDGFITQLSGLLMMIKVADCQAILLHLHHQIPPKYDHHDLQQFFYRSPTQSRIFPTLWKTRKRAYWTWPTSSRTPKTVR